MTTEFNKIVHNHLGTYVETCFQGAVDRFARYYANKIYGKETKLTSIKKMLKDDYVFSEEDVKNLSIVMDNPALLEDYYVSELKSIKDKLENSNKNESSTNKPLKASVSENIVGKQDVVNAIQNYICKPAESPMLIFCENHECIEYIISKANIQAVTMETVLFDDYRQYYFANIVNGIKEQPYDILVGTIKMKETSSAHSVSSVFQSYKGIINDVTKKHFILIVECADEQQRKLLFKTFINEKDIISYTSESAVVNAVANIKANPQQGLGWGYGTLPDMFNTKYIKDPRHARPNDYLCYNKNFGITLNYGKAAAKRVKGVSDEHYRTFASILSKAESALNAVGSGDPEEDKYSLHYDLDLSKIMSSSGVKPDYSWFVSEFQRAKDNTQKLADNGCSPAIASLNHKSFPGLKEMWYLPSLVELVAARKDLVPGLYWSSSVSEGCNLIYDSANNKVIEVSDSNVKAWVVPFITVERGR